MSSNDLTLAFSDVSDVLDFRANTERSLSVRKMEWLTNATLVIKNAKIRILRKLDHFHNREKYSQYDCFLMTNPPVGSGKYRVGSIHDKYQWTIEGKRRTLSVNRGVLVLLAEGTLSKDQIAGYVNDSWHLSHKCGNWTCMNSIHMQLESGSINSSRIVCLRSPGPKRVCEHYPTCLPKYKRWLIITQIVRNEILLAISKLNAAGFMEHGLSSLIQAIQSDLYRSITCSECHSEHRGTPLCDVLDSHPKTKDLRDILNMAEENPDDMEKACAHVRRIILDLRLRDDFHHVPYLQM